MLASSHNQEGFMQQKDKKEADINILRCQIKSGNTFEEIFQELFGDLIAEENRRRKAMLEQISKRSE